MSDCSNAEIRDLLPDLLHDRLDAPTRARVVAHLDDCADCRSELELLRSLRSSLERGTPRVDLDRIVAALPAPATVQPRQRRTGWRVWSDWRVAAAVSFIVAGGTSMVVLRNVGDRGSDSTTAQRIVNVASETTERVDSPAAVGAARQVEPRPTTNPAPRVARPVSSGRGAESVASVDEQGAGLANSRIGDLNERQLKSLLNAIEHMDATPITEPEPVTLHVGSRASSPNGL